MQEDEDAGIFREIRARDTNTKALEAMPLPTGTNNNTNTNTSTKKLPRPIHNALALRHLLLHSWTTLPSLLNIKVQGIGGKCREKEADT